MRRMAAEFRGQFMDAMRDAEIEDIKADVGKLAESAKIDPRASIRWPKSRRASQALWRRRTNRRAPPVPPAIAAPGEANSSLNSIALPRLPEAPESSTGTFLAEGVAPAVPEPESWTRFRPQGARRRHGCRDAGARRCAHGRDWRSKPPRRAGAAKTQDKV